MAVATRSKTREIRQNSKLFLPPELWNQICQSLSIEEICALRLSCIAWSLGTYDYFADQLFHDFYLTLTSDGLRALEYVASHKIFSAHVKVSKLREPVHSMQYFEYLLILKARDFGLSPLSSVENIHGHLMIFTDMLKCCGRGNVINDSLLRSALCPGLRLVKGSGPRSQSIMAVLRSQS